MDRRSFLKLTSVTALAKTISTISVADTGASEPFVKSVEQVDDWTRYVNDDSIYVKHGVIPGTEEFETAQQLKRKVTIQDEGVTEDWGIDPDHPYYTDPNYGTDYQDLAAAQSGPETVI